MLFIKAWLSDKMLVFICNVFKQKNNRKKNSIGSSLIPCKMTIQKKEIINNGQEEGTGTCVSDYSWKLHTTAK